jgi:hypothetical protein
MYVGKRWKEYPFLMSYGDGKGHGTHADYVLSWKGDALQRAMDSSCRVQACENGRPLKPQQASETNKCAARRQVDEQIDGFKPLVDFGKDIN